MQDQEGVIPFLASAGWLAHFKRQHNMKNTKFALEAGSEDQEVVEKFRKYLLSVRKRVRWVGILQRF